MRNSTIILAAVLLFFTAAMTAQQVKPTFEKQGELIKGTFYYEDGSISQEGTYKDGKLHGKWISYDESGKEIAMANYEEGKKSGKWFFWSPEQLIEVDYNHNRIAEVTSYNNKSKVVNRD